MEGMIRRSCRVLAVVAGGILLSGWFALLPIPGTGATLEEKLADFVAEVGTKPQNNAVAVARDPKRWGWGWAAGRESPEEAGRAALESCRVAAERDKVAAPCQIHAVNGVVVAPAP